MAFSDYQQTYAWQAALELGPRLTQLAEELPAAEQHGLAAALRSLALELPTAVAIDIQNKTDSRLPIIVRLQTALELTARIYPALDNAMVENALAAQLDRLTGSTFSEAIPAPEPLQSEPVEIPAQIDQPTSEDDRPDTSGTAISITPQSVPVAEEPAIVPTNSQQ